MAYSRYGEDSDWYIFWSTTPARGHLPEAVASKSRDMQILAVWHLEHRAKGPSFTYAQVVAMLDTGDFSAIPGYTDADRELIVGCLSEFIRDVNLDCESLEPGSTRP